mgnify:CR=1 FL=1
MFNVWYNEVNSETATIAVYAEYNNEKYGFIDTAIIYSEQGKAKTEKLVYEGYRIVEEK